MTKRTVTILAVAAIMVVIAAPILLALHFARKVGIDTEKRHALSYAQDALLRSETTTAQIESAFKRLATTHSRDPCSEDSQSLMRQIDLVSSYIQAIGFVSGNRFICSSLGAELNKANLGPPDLIRPTGVKLRLNVEFPFAPGIKFLVTERDGYAAIIHKDLPIDVSTEEKDVALATMAFPENRVLTSRGTLKQEWIKDAVEKNRLAGYFHSDRGRLRTYSAT
jgi:sensor c-di-GMP phosphodiesterase-like protein